ncbi:MAG: hypothetical protein Kow002_17880 [Anaerolineales bacterium]
MNTKNENPKNRQVENPIQEGRSTQMDRRVVLTAEAVLSARKLEVQEDAKRTHTPLFVP